MWWPPMGHITRTVALCSVSSPSDNEILVSQINQQQTQTANSWKECGQCDTNFATYVHITSTNMGSGMTGSSVIPLIPQQHCYLIT